LQDFGKIMDMLDDEASASKWQLRQESRVERGGCFHSCKLQVADPRFSKSTALALEKQARAAHGSNPEGAA
jgi:hypothetical protein